MLDLLQCFVSSCVKVFLPKYQFYLSKLISPFLLVYLKMYPCTLHRENQIVIITQKKAKNYRYIWTRLTIVRNETELN